MSLSEKEIKLKVIEYLLKKRVHDIVVPEVTVGHKSLTHKQVRADIFAINGDISIYEIKSEKYLDKCFFLLFNSSNILHMTLLMLQHQFTNQKTYMYTCVVHVLMIAFCLT